MSLSYSMEQADKETTTLMELFDPRTKLTWYILMLFFSLYFETALPLGLVLLASIASSLILTGSLKQYKVLILLMFLLGLQIFIIQLLFCREGELLYQWGIIKIYSEAIPLATTGLLKATIIVLASMQFFTSAPAMDFTLMLLKFKVPYRFAMLVGLAVRFLPILKEEYTSILNSQRTRGLKMDTIWDNIKAFPPTFLPFLYRAVRHSTETALAMELRGYGRSKHRTFARDITLKGYDIALITLMFVVIAASLFL